MFRLDKREGWSNGAGIMHKISVLACLYLCLCVFTYFCIVQAGLGVEGMDQSNGACMMGIFDTFVFFVFVHICVYLCIC